MELVGTVIEPSSSLGKEPDPFVSPATARAPAELRACRLLLLDVLGLEADLAALKADLGGRLWRHAAVVPAFSAA